jgi:hypothetical protein
VQTVTSFTDKDELLETVAHICGIRGFSIIDFPRGLRYGGGCRGEGIFPVGRSFLKRRLPNSPIFRGVGCCSNWTPFEREEKCMGFNLWWACTPGLSWCLSHDRLLALKWIAQLKRKEGKKWCNLYLCHLTTSMVDILVSSWTSLTVFLER